MTKAVNKDILNIIIPQIPMMIMALSNGSSITTVIPLLMIPVIIHIINNLYPFYRYLVNEKIPKKYVTYTIENDNRDYSYGYSVAYVRNFSYFLNEFYPETISKGNIKRYKLENSPSSSLMKYFCALIDPDDTYFCKIILSKKIDGMNILENMKKKGFIFPSSFNPKKMLDKPIFLEFNKKPFTKSVKGKDEVSYEDVIKISAIDFASARSFVDLVNNFRSYMDNRVQDFKLTKTIYFYSDKDRSLNNYSELSFNISINKNYENVFLTKKNSDLIKNSISSWIVNKENNLNMGIPDKLGFFFIGSPGCGKSSLIYAIANETKKKIASINMKNFDDKSFLSLMSVMENRVIIFEDIDALTIVHNRDKEKIKKSPSDRKKIVLKSSNKDDNKSKIIDKSLTLDTILEVLDGYSCLNNCIIIMTSNHPEKIDPALIRPGRIDHIIHFELCTEHQFRRMFKYFLKIDYKQIDKTFVFPENTYSTSHLINTIILPNMNNPRNVINILKEGKKEKS